MRILRDGNNLGFAGARPETLAKFLVKIPDYARLLHDACVFRRVTGGPSHKQGQPAVSELPDP